MARLLPVDGQALCGDLPLELGRQSLAGPTRERVGLVVADVGDGRGALDWQQAFERHGEPRAVALLPVEGACQPSRLTVPQPSESHSEAVR